MNSAHGYTEGAEESDEFKLHNYRAMENRLLSANSDIKSLRDQLSKERENSKIKEEELTAEWEHGYNSAMREANEQLEKERELTKVLTQEVADLRVSNSLLIDNENKEREMRKDLVWAVEQLLNPKPSLASDLPKIESLIAKASELDKNN